MPYKVIPPELVNLLKPLADKIDAELAKEQIQRQDIEVEVNNPGKLKNQLEYYKVQLRKDWYMKFQMWKKEKENKLIIRFKSPLNSGYKILDPIKDEEGGYRIVETDRVLTPDEVPQSISDADCFGLMLAGNHKFTVFIDGLNQDTQEFLKDPQNKTETALIAGARRLGYRIDLQDTRVRFMYG